LLLLHGSGPGVTGWANFQGNLSLFAQHFRCLILDMPGYGGSDPVEGHPILTLADATVRFMDALKIDKANIIGNSLGGIVGSHVAANHPQRVVRFVTIGGLGMNLFSSFPGEGINRLVEFAENPTRELLVAWLRSMVFDPAVVTDELVEERFKRATTPQMLETSRKLYSRAGMQAMAQAFRGPGALAGVAHLGKIEAPTLITWGRDDRVSPIDLAILPMRIIPRAELHTFYNCGHWAMIERKEEFESVVLSFLKRP
jgi:pimeloyl-ACP methyl ester carboxylesterase